MKKMLNISIYYAAAAMIGGVFYREFTKFQGFVDQTSLGKLHTHLFGMGMLLFLLVAFFCKDKRLPKNRKFKKFLIFYNIGLPLTVFMMLIRGVAQVKDLELSRVLNASISGIAGIGHILTSIGLIFLLLSLKDIAED